MGSVEFVLALEERMELVRVGRGWWVAFGAPRQAAPAQRQVPVVEPAEARGGTIPPPEPRRRERREPQPPTPRPRPDPAPVPVPDPQPTPDLPDTPRGRGSSRS
jgi:hypothetical protein